MLGTWGSPQGEQSPSNRGACCTPPNDRGYLAMAGQGTELLAVTALGKAVFQHSCQNIQVKKKQK